MFRLMFWPMFAFRWNLCDFYRRRYQNLVSYDASSASIARNSISEKKSMLRILSLRIYATSQHVYKLSNCYCMMLLYIVLLLGFSFFFSLLLRQFYVLYRCLWLPANSIELQCLVHCYSFRWIWITIARI